MNLPCKVINTKVPPIKCQGIKTKLVPFILRNISWNNEGRWVEPFLGSGVVLFNALPDRALVSDSNVHIINLYKDIQSGSISSKLVREYLQAEGEKLLQIGDSYYYEVRDRFNKTHQSLDFLFLSRACFNGVMRFNKKGGFNVPFCKKPERFRQAYITKIVNQVQNVSNIIKDRDWIFRCCDWRETLAECQKNDFIYLDPPYIGRHTDYFNSWTEEDAKELAGLSRSLPCGFALSMWKENQYRQNTHLEECWSGMIERSFTHFYHVGASENLRNSMEEVLMIKPGFESNLLETEWCQKECRRITL